MEQTISGTRTKRQRDPYIDLLRADSLFVVVVWHWVFSVVWWGADGPHTTNPTTHDDLSCWWGRRSAQ